MGAAVQNIWLRVDGLFADSLLRFRGRAVPSVIGGLAGLTAGAALAVPCGLWGMALGTALGRAVAVIGLPVLVSRGTGIGMKTYLEEMGRPVATGALLLFIASSIEFRDLTVPVFLGLVAIVALTAAGIMWGIGFTHTQRTTIQRRVQVQFGALFRSQGEMAHP